MMKLKKNIQQIFTGKIRRQLQIFLKQRKFFKSKDQIEILGQFKNEGDNKYNKT